MPMNDKPKHPRWTYADSECVSYAGRGEGRR